MAKKLYVGNLSWNVTDDSLKDTFSQAGTVVSANVITDKMTGRSRGFGFVEMSSDEEAERAIESLNGKELDGRSITVNEAKPMADRPPRRDFGGRDSGRRPPQRRF
ncbi:MAG: RNA-binding protein [Patescibacteria group bacterium]